MRVFYIIRGKYGKRAWENIDVFEERWEAEKVLQEYNEAFGPGWSLKITEKNIRA